MAIIGSDEKAQLERFLRDKTAEEMAEIKRFVNLLICLLIDIKYVT